MHVQVLLVIYSIILHKIDGAPRMSFASLFKDFPLDPEEDLKDSCPKGSTCLRFVKCPEQNRTLKTHKLCSERHGGPWVCCMNHNATTLEYSPTPNMNLIKPLSRTHPTTFWNNTTESVVPVTANETQFTRTENNTNTLENFNGTVPAPAEYRRHYGYGSWDTTSERNYGRDPYYDPSRDHSHKWGDYDWSHTSGRRDMHGNVDPDHEVNPRSKATSSPGKDSSYWSSKSTTRPPTKTTKSSWWGNGYGKSTTVRGYIAEEDPYGLNKWSKETPSEKPYWNGKSTARPSSTKSSWRQDDKNTNNRKYTSTQPPRKVTTTRPMTRGSWNSHQTSSTAKTMEQGNRIPTQPSGRKGTTKYLVLSTTPSSRRKPVPWGSYLTTETPTRGRGTTGKSYGRTTASTRRTPPSEAPPVRWPTRSTAGRYSTTKKYSSTTPMPDVNLNLCGIRQANGLSSRRGRNARLEHNSEEVAIFSESKNEEKSRATFQRIVGGREAEPFSWPWVAALYRVAASGGNRLLSAGSLINENYVLTAAHVFTPDDLRTSSYVVMLGTHTAKEAVAEYEVASVLQHPKYQHRFYYYDIALLRLSRPVAFNNYIMPVCLPSPAMPLMRDEDIEGKRATVMGWGDESFGGITSRVLREATLTIVSRKTCNASYTQVASSRFPQGITDNMLCAGDPNGGKDACQGDSGGPLTTVENGRYTQVGIVSFGFKCGDKDYPGVYTKVAPYLSWIAENTLTRDYDYYS